MKVKKKNKGFTLIELIMAIALLSIISVISFVSISAIIAKNKDNQCDTVVQSIKAATKSYFSDNRLALLKNPNASISGASYDAGTGVYTVTAKTLSDKGYLSGNITNPYDASDTITLNNISIKVTLKADKTVNNITIKYLVGGAEKDLFNKPNCKDS